MGGTTTQHLETDLKYFLRAFFEGKLQILLYYNCLYI